MGIIIKTDLFPETLDETLNDDDIKEQFDDGFQKKYSLLEVFLFLLTFALGIVCGVLLTKFV